MSSGRYRIAREPTLTLKGHTDFVHCVAFSPDGRRIVSGSIDRTLKVWDATTGQEMAVVLPEPVMIVLQARREADPSGILV